MPLCAGHRLQLSGAGKAGRTHPWVPDGADPDPLDLRLTPKARRGEASAVLSLLPRLWSPQEMMTWALGDLEQSNFKFGVFLLTLETAFILGKYLPQRAAGNR